MNLKPTLKEAIMATYDPGVSPIENTFAAFRHLVGHRPSYLILTHQDLILLEQLEDTAIDPDDELHAFFELMG